MGEEVYAITVNGFKVGDVVQLKSGGPKMTVTGFIKKDTQPSQNENWDDADMFMEVKCIWMSEEDEYKYRTAAFSYVLLDKVEKA